MVDLNDIALFVQVVRFGSFAEAARRLAVPANTVSRRVQALEGQLGTRLLQRSTRKLTLTDAGRIFQERCASPVDGLIHAGEELTSGNSEAGGMVRVAVPADFFDFFLMEWMADFLVSHPRVRIEFVLSDAKADLIAERIDVAIRGGALQDSSHIGRQLVRDGNDLLVASPAYLAARGSPRTVEDLSTHDCVSFSHHSGRTTWHLTGPDDVERAVQIVPRFSGNAAQSLRKAAVAGIGIALLPHAMTTFDLQARRLIRVLPHYRCKGHGVNVVYPSRRHLPLAVSAFIDHVAQKLSALDASVRAHQTSADDALEDALAVGKPAGTRQPASRKRA